MINIGADWANPQVSEPRVKTASPIENSLRRP